MRRFVPESMRSIGVAMHEAASRSAVGAQDAGARGDVMQRCVARHATYRLH